MTQRAPLSEEELELRLSEPDEATCEALRAVDGDILVLGAGGKMGPTLARMARRALNEIDAARGQPNARKVIAVSRFSNAQTAAQLEHHGIEVVRADLSNPAAYHSLPKAANVIWMVGQKFGTTGDPVGTWTQNVAAAAYGAEHCAGSRVVCFSSGNVYARGSLLTGGSRESDTLTPDGEYSASCIGRERVFESAARRLGFPLMLFRLFYACDLRYGVVTDIALRVLHGEMISLSTPAVNVIWQGTANQLALQSLTLASTPAATLNVSGRIASVRRIAERVAWRLDCTVHFDEPAGANPHDVLLANTERLQQLLPHQALELETLCDWAADWVASGKHLLSKPTKFEARDGKF